MKIFMLKYLVSLNQDILFDADDQSILSSLEVRARFNPDSCYLTVNLTPDCFLYDLQSSCHTNPKPIHILSPVKSSICSSVLLKRENFAVLINSPLFTFSFKRILQSRCHKSHYLLTKIPVTLSCILCLALVLC